MAGSTIVTFIDSPICEKELNIKADYLNLNIDALNIDLDGELNVIYDSILPFVVDVLEDFFINEFNQIFLDFLLD